MNDNLKLLTEKVKSTVGQCDRCGSCTNVCPLYLVNPIEKSVARGKVSITRALIEQGLNSNRAIQEALNYCLLCKACTDVCPSKIMTDEVMIEARQYLNEEIGPTFTSKVVANVMKNNTLINIGSSLIKLSRSTKVSTLFPSLIPKEYPNKWYQGVKTGPAAMTMLETENNKMLDKPEKVAYFKGCAMKMFFPEASQATVEVLSKVAKVNTPESVCCGMPQLSQGMIKQAKELAKKNIEAFADASLIVTDCASCGSMLKQYAKRLEDEPEWKEKAEEFSSKIMGLSEFLTKVSYKPEKKDVKVTYHDSCHLAREQGIKKEPRELLQQATNFIENDKSSMCCGGSGSFQYKYPLEANKVLNLKVKSIEDTNAEILVTECPSCIMQLSKAGKYKVLHISQVL